MFEWFRKGRKPSGGIAEGQMTPSVQEVTSSLVKVRPKYQSTLASGVNQELWKEAEFKAATGMPIDDFAQRLDHIQKGIEDIKEAQARMEGRNSFIDQTVGRLATVVEGEKGLNVRVQSLEDTRNWYERILLGALTIVLAAFITHSLGVWH
jgi:hypothetical protein